MVGRAIDDETRHAGPLVSKNALPGSLALKTFPVSHHRAPTCGGRGAAVGCDLGLCLAGVLAIVA